jgi:hypothetical protein
MSRTLHNIPTEVFRVRITWSYPGGIDHTVDLGPYLSLGTAKACVTREMPQYSQGRRVGRAEIFRYQLQGEGEVVK